MELTFETVMDAFDAALELVDDDDQREKLTRVIAASRASVERATQDLVAGVVDEVNANLSGRARVDLRVTPEGLEINVTTERAAVEGEDEESWQFGESEVEKVTLRVPVELKDRATGAAKESGMSLNAWFTRLLARELREPKPDEPRREARSRRRDRREGRGGRKGHGNSLKGWIGR